MSPATHTLSPTPGLTLIELQQLVESYATAPQRWRPALQDPVPGEDRCAVRLESPEGVDVWLISWRPSQAGALHDHGDSGAAFAVVEGSLTELRPQPDGRTSRVEHAAGTSQTVPVDQVHDVIADRSAAVSIHAYSPPLEQMSYYRDRPGADLELIKTVVSNDPDEGHPRPTA